MLSPLINIEAEALILGAMMIPGGGDIADALADRISAHDFAEPLHGRIFEIIVHERAAGKAVTPVLLKRYFEDDPAIEAVGGVGYLARLTADGQGLLSPFDLADQLKELATRRRISDGSAATIRACADFNLTIEEIAAQADAAIQVDGNGSLHEVSGAESIDELLASYALDPRGVTCSTIRSVDELLGPMRPKQLIIGAGRPGMGKTAVALSYALGAARRGHGVLFVSLEMGSEELAARLAADLCFDEQKGGIGFSRIRDGHLTDPEYRRIREARAGIEGMPLTIVDASGLSISRLNRLVRRHARRFAAREQKLELVIVDYLQLISPDHRGRSSYEATSEVSRGLKMLAKEQGVAVFALAQLSREVEKRPDKRPQLSDLRDSGQIEQDADAVLFLFRQEYYLRLAEPAEDSAKHAEWEAALGAVQGEIEFVLSKRRNGRTGTAKGTFYASYQSVRG